MVAYNASAPAVLGLEWWPTVPKTYPIAAGQPSLGLRVPSLGAETIAALRLGVASNPATTSRIFTLVDIYPAGSEVGAPIQVVEYAPNADNTIGNWTTEAGGVVNLFARIDDAVTYPPTGTDYIRQIVGGNSAYRCDVASAGFPATARVLRLSIRAVIGMVSLPGTAFVEFNLFHGPSSTVYSPPSNIIFTNGLTPNYVLTIDCGEINPVTLLPWTPADVQSFDASTWQLRVASAGAGGNGAQIPAMALRVSYVDPEPRVAVATYRRPSGAIVSPISTDALVAMPAGTATWAKANGVTYTYVPRAARDRLVGGTAPVANDLAWRAAQQDLGAGGNPAGVTFSPGGLVASVLNIDEHGQITNSFASEIAAVPRLVLRTSAPADSLDSPVYLNDGSTTVLRSVTAAQPAGQRLTPAATRTYLGVRALIAPPASGAATLTIGVFTGGGAFATPVGGTLVFTADQVRALPEITGSGGLRYLEGFLSAPATLTNGTAYEVRMTPSTGTWKGLAPSAVGAGGVSLGGTTWFAQTGGGSQTEQDLAIMVLEQPAAPTALTTQVVAQLQSGDGCFCTVADVDQIQIDWVGPSPALGVTFLRYEIERDEDDGRGFLPVWWVTSAESASRWVDYEMPFDRPVKYRVRAVSTSTAFSAWVATGWATASSRAAEVVYTSNHEPGLQVVYDHDPHVTSDFLDHRADVVHPIYGADYQVAFFEPEDRGVSDRLRLTVNFGRQPVDSLGRPINMQALWEPLRAITRSTDIPYVCVRQPHGARVFAQVTLSNPDKEEPGWRYWCDAEATPLQDVPTVGTS